MSVSRSLVSALMLTASGWNLAQSSRAGNHSRGQAAAQQRRQAELAAIVEDAHAVAIGNATRFRILGMNLSSELARLARFHFAVALVIGKGRGFM